MKIDPSSKADLSAQIAKAIRDAIVAGELIVDERLPSEAELSEQFEVSRATVREALKRLAAQSLIRTQRGAFGGAFVNRLSFEEAYGQQITTSTLLLSMNAVSFDVACEARFALERACAPLSAYCRPSFRFRFLQSVLCALYRQDAWSGRTAALEPAPQGNDFCDRKRLILGLSAKFSLPACWRICSHLNACSLQSNSQRLGPGSWNAG